MLQKRKQHDLLDAWAQKTMPPDTYRWPLKAEDNRLDATPQTLASVADN